MIYIGLTGWGDHDALYPNGTSAGDKLKEYSGHFPIVEVDASFYAVQPQRNAEKWVKDTPESFQFIVKAYQGMTGHQRGDIPFDSKEEMFQAFHHSIAPYQAGGKLGMVLFQFPPWFECKKENVSYLRWCKEQMGEVPVALEFRHQSWFAPNTYEKTLTFMEQEKWIHSICDEPQAGSGSIPAVVRATDNNKTLIRMHGRNVHGWTRPANGEDWREVRYLYRYNQQELQEWHEKIDQLKDATKDIYLLFNNNSGGDAADNAKQMQKLLNIEYEDLAPRQLDLFSGE
ncbi:MULTISPECIES: DUF72 domain-containing protein [Metabacillus]|uniref:DUF72 domain-containing protein n=1 Tax=Metabacillus hrfriensis TaxID=3048891 RepID=A0ACD4RAS4_9BACI|nr:MULTISPECIES: DUF72 domain-containing protein [Metabacillus]UAL51729.1 DUF72 domain-containing protein [Metabacillus dongyingensis]UOK57574.1 DUF72 domain-containing protein [Bacillus sp. OVS6]USK28036.1 DUF72 domain-containing protein [Bacillus sp. CMF21]WHZ57242.1 DUF72 domain-containing protein [Metabacillus sp. CT-WN-B3]